MENINVYGEITMLLGLQLFGEAKKHVKTIPSTMQGRRIITIKQPVGVCGIITVEFSSCYIQEVALLLLQDVLLCRYSLKTLVLAKRAGIPMCNKFNISFWKRVIDNYVKIYVRKISFRIF